MKWQVISKPGKKKIRVKQEEEVGVMMVITKPGNYEVAVELMERGAKALVLGLILGKDKDKIRIVSQTRHWVKNTHAETVIYGVNKGESETELFGLIKIDKKANQATDFLTARILLLSEKARAEIEPSLEIKADEVRASHAATVSAIDKEQEFYLMSRGLKRAEAEKIIVSGFINQVIGMINNDKIQSQIRRELDNAGY